MLLDWLPRGVLQLHEEVMLGEGGLSPFLFLGVTTMATYQATSGQVSKDKAKSIAKQALSNSNTAEGAARYIKDHTSYPQQGFSPHHKDTFNPEMPEYVNSGDYAEQAKDNRWLVIHRTVEGQGKTQATTPR